MHRSPVIILSSKVVPAQPCGISPVWDQMTETQRAHCNHSFCLSSSLFLMPCPTHITFCASLAHLCSQIRALLGCIWVPLPVPTAWKLLEGRQQGVIRWICVSIFTLGTYSCMACCPGSENSCFKYFVQLSNYQCQVRTFRYCSS